MKATCLASGENCGIKSRRVGEIATTGGAVLATPAPDVFTLQMFMSTKHADVHHASRLARLAPRNHRRLAIFAHERQTRRRTVVGNSQSPQPVLCRAKALRAIWRQSRVVCVELFGASRVGSPETVTLPPSGTRYISPLSGVTSRINTSHLPFGDTAGSRP